MGTGAFCQPGLPLLTIRKLSMLMNRRCPMIVDASVALLLKSLLLASTTHFQSSVGALRVADDYQAAFVSDSPGRVLTVVPSKVEVQTVVPRKEACAAPCNQHCN